MAKLVLILLFSLSASLLGSSQNKEPEDTKTSQDLASWIMHIVIDKGEENEKIKRNHITYDKRMVTYNLKNNPPLVIESSVVEIYGDDNKSMERLKEQDGRPVRNARPKQGQFDFNRVLTERYDFNLEKEVFENGRGYYRISFQPKEPINKLPFENRFDEGINRMAGYLLVDMEKFYVKQLEGHLIQSFTKALGIFEMRDFTLNLEQEEFEGAVVPKFMVVTYRYRVFRETYEKQEYFYSNRRIY